VDSVHVELRRTSDSTVALDTAFAITPSDSIDLSLRVVLNETGETFWLALECFDPAGNLVFAAGPLEVTATSSSGDVEAQDIDVEYVGVGSDAVAVRVVSDLTHLQMGNTYTVEAHALDGSGEPIPETPIKWISEDENRLSVPQAGVGQIVAGLERGWVHLIAELLTGPADTVDLYVEPVPSEIAIFSGDNQTGIAGTQLPVMLEVQVTAPDGPVEGMLVDFTTTAGGAFGQASMATDAEGYAWTPWTLGPGPGQQTATATVRNYPDLQATFTATAFAPSGTIHWVEPVDGNWSNPGNWSTGTVPSDTDLVAIEVAGSYTVTLDVSSSISGLVVGGSSGTQTLHVADTLVLSGGGTVAESGVMVLDGGAYDGGGLLSVSGELRWEGTSGVVNSTFGSGVTRIEPAGTFLLQGNVNQFWGGHTIENLGLTSWTGTTRVDASDGATFINRAGGTFEALGTRGFQLIPGNIEPQFINEGTFIRDGEFTVKMVLPFDNHGVVEVRSGYLALTGGGTGTGSFVSQANLNFGEPGGSAYTLAASSSVTGSGTVTFAGLAGFVAPHLVSGTYAVDGLTFISDSRVEFSANDASTTRTLLLRGSIEGAGTLVVRDTLTWDRGAMSGTGSVDVASDATMIIEPGNGAKEILGGRVVRNYGVAVWTGEDVTIGDGSVFRNEAGGSFDAQADDTFMSGAGGGTFFNAGTFGINGPSLPVFDVAFENSGTVDIQVGTLDLNAEFLHLTGAVVSGSGTLDLSDASVTQFQGDVNPGTSAGVLNITGDLPQGASSTCNIELSGPTVGTEYDQLNVSGLATLNGTLNVITSFTPTLGQTFTVLTFGSVEGSFATITGLDLGAGLTLQPQWNANSLNLVATGAPTGGTVAWLSNFVDTDWHNPANWDLGRVPTAADTAQIVADVTVTVQLASNATVARLEVGGPANTNTQAVTVAQGVTLRIDSSATVETSGQLLVSEGTLAGTATIAIAGGMSWTGGGLAGTGTLLISPAATLAIDGSSFTIDGFIIDNRGTAAWLSGTLTGLNNPRFLNDASATFEMASDGTWGGAGSFQNDGAFRYTGTTIGTFGWALTNAGTLDAVGPNGILRLIGDFTHQDGAIIQGSGTLDFTTTPVLGWDGDVNPGGTGATGILHFVGSGSPSPLFTANVEIGGTTAGTEYDQATVSQTLTVNGTLNVDLINGFQPQLGQTFTILTFGDRIGEFSDTTGLAIPGDLAFDLVWNTTSLDLVVVDAGPVSPADVIFFSDSGGGLDYGVFTNSADGSSLTRVANTGPPLQFLIAPRWSMDRQRIAFTNDASGTSNLYMATSAGAELTELVNNIASGHPRWSHNGQHLGFICRPAVAGVDHICVIPNVAGPIGDIPLNSHVMPTAAMPSEWQTGSHAADWDPRPASHDRFLFARDSGAVVVSRFFSLNYDGTGLDTITTDVLQVDGGPLRVLDMDVSADGAMMVFVGFDTQSLTERLYVVNTDGTGLRQLTFPTGTVYDERPLFSPDGSEVLFGRRDDFCNLTYWIVAINNTDGSLERQITGDVLSCEMDPYDQVGMDWSPNGDRITLVGIDETYNWWRVYVVPSTVTPVNYLQVRVPIGRDADAISWLFEGQPNWRP
jgi:hypothetical protein